MSVTVKIPAQLRAATGGEGELEVEGSTVGEALDAVFDQHDGLRERITQDGDLRRFVNVYVSGEDIRFQDGLDTEVSDGDEVTILPAVAGGSPSRELMASGPDSEASASPGSSRTCGTSASSKRVATRPAGFEPAASRSGGERSIH